MRQQLSPVLASQANVFRIPVVQSSRSLPITVPLSHSVSRVCAGAASSAFSAARSFSSTPAALAKKGRPRIDRRITLIRYFLYHPLTPRPLRFSRNRYLRHWTIHRAWQLYRAKQRQTHQAELRGMWESMKNACEELRTGAGDGGKLFRISMNKKGVFSTPLPIEYGRLQTESPSKEGWNYDWKR